MARVGISREIQRKHVLEALEALAEDAEDLAAFRERASEPYLPFEDVVKDLKRRGKI